MPARPSNLERAILRTTPRSWPIGVNSAKGAKQQLIAFLESGRATRAPTHPATECEARLSKMTNYTKTLSECWYTDQSVREHIPRHNEWRTRSDVAMHSDTAHRDIAEH